MDCGIESVSVPVCSMEDLHFSVFSNTMIFCAPVSEAVCGIVPQSTKSIHKRSPRCTVPKIFVQRGYPLVAPQEAPVVQEFQRSSTDSRAQRGQDLKRIMLVDDEAIITMQLEKRLTSMGYTVVGVASSGEEALTLAKEMQRDIVLMDIVMPGTLDGIDAAAKIRSELDIPIIFLTAFADESNINRAKRAEPFGYIVKPFHEKEIQASIEVALHKRMIERRLRDDEELYRTIMRDAFDPIIITDAGGRILEVNERAVQFLGCKREELIGSDASLVLPREKQKRLKRGSQENNRKLLDGVLITDDGREVSVHISASDVSYSGRHAVLQILNEVIPQGTQKKQWKRLFTRQIPNKEQVQKGDKESESIRVSRPENCNKYAVPICASCKKIRISHDEWIRFESFFKELYGVDFSHGICSECAHRLWPDMPPEVKGRTEV